MRVRRVMTLEVLVRVLADAVIINTAYLAALVVRFLWRIATVPEVSAQVELGRVIQTYVMTFWLLTVICLLVYSASGFYTRGRFYQGRFKAWIIFQAVSISYLLFGAIMYLAVVRTMLPETPGMALVLGWFLTLVATMAARLWAVLWRAVIKRESPARRKIEQDDRIQHVLVVGGAGYMGSVLCRQLLRRGYSVRVLDTLLYGKESLAELMGDPHFELLEGDSRDVGDVFRAMLDMDAVVHLGELVGDPACALDEKLTLEINLAATRMLAEAARGYGVKRFVYASSCSVYGAGSDSLNERSALHPVSLYARAKIVSEQALLALDGSDFHPVILRFATLYGLSPRPRFDLVVNLLTARAVCDGEVTIFGGEQWRPFIHVADAANAIVGCLEAPLTTVKGKVFNVGSDEQNHTITQIGELIQRLIPDARLVLQGDNKDGRDYHVSFAKIRRELGFLTTHTVDDGVREIEAVLREGRITDYRATLYSNYRTLSESGGPLHIRSKHIPELYAVHPPESTARSSAPVEGIGQQA